MFGEIIAPDLVIVVTLAAAAFLVWVFIMFVRAARHH